MLLPTASLRRAVAIHEAAYAVAARSLSIALRRPTLRKGLRRYFAGVIDFDTDDGSEQFCTNAAIIMWTGDAALALLAPDARSNTRDHCEGLDVLYLGLVLRRGESLRTPSIYREFHTTVARLQAEAEAFVLENRADIIETAETLSKSRRKPRQKPSQQAA